MMDRYYQARDIIEKFNLEPLEPEGGWFSRFWYKRGEISSIYYLISEGEFSEFHCLPYQELYYFLLGDPVELYTAVPGSGRILKTVLGQELEKGHDLTRLVEPDVIQGSRLAEGGRWALLSTVMHPPFEPEIYRTCPPDELNRAFPGNEDLIKSLTKWNRPGK